MNFFSWKFAAVIVGAWTFSELAYVYVVEPQLAKQGWLK